MATKKVRRAKPFTYRGIDVVPTIGDNWRVMTGEYPEFSLKSDAKEFIDFITFSGYSYFAEF